MEIKNIDIDSTESDVIKILTLLLSISMKYGIPFVLEILKNIEEEKITEEDIENLKIRKNPEDYFPNYNS